MAATHNVGTLSYEMKLDTADYRRALRQIRDDTRTMARSASSAFSSIDASARASGNNIGSAYRAGTANATQHLNSLNRNSNTTFNNMATNANRSSGRIKGALSAGLAAGAVGVTAALGGMVVGIKASVEAASNQEQAFGAVDQILGSNSKTIKKWAANQWSIGLSTTEASNSVVYMTQMLMNNGMAAKEAADKGMKLTELGADMAATFGGKTVDAVDALSAALRGETDPIERYGVSMKEASIQAYAISKGLQKAEVDMTKVNSARASLTKAEEKAREVAKDAKSTEGDKAKATADVAKAEAAVEKALGGKIPKLDAATKAQSVYGLIMEQTSKYQGQATRESKTYEGQLGRLKAQWTNLKANAGTAFLPTIVEGLEKLNAAMPKLQTVVAANVPKIKKFLQDVFTAVKANWPQIVDTAKTFGDALKRTAGFAKIMWDAFNALPPGVKATLATLLILKKTGVIDVGLRIADLGKLLLQKLGLMTIQAGVVHVNGGVPGGRPGAPGTPATRPGTPVTPVPGRPTRPPSSPRNTPPATTPPPKSGFGWLTGITAALAGFGGLKALFESPQTAKDMSILNGKKSSLAQDIGVSTAQALGRMFESIGLADLTKYADPEGKGAVRRLVLDKFDERNTAISNAAWSKKNSEDPARNKRYRANMLKQFPGAKFGDDGLILPATMILRGPNTAPAINAIKKVPNKKSVGVIAAVGGAITNLNKVKSYKLPPIEGKVKVETKSAFDRLKSFFGDFNNLVGTIPVVGPVYQIAKKVFGFADGGFVSGPGTGTSDSIPARLSHGEYVVRADAVRRIGVNALDSINQGFASGGYVSQGAGMSIGSVTVVAQDTSKFEREMRAKSRAASLAGRR